MRIALLANTKSPNPGNWALNEGTKNLIKKKFGNKVKFVQISWDDITFSDSKFDNSFFKLVNSCDLLWVVGAVMFNDRSEHTNGGSRFNLNIAELQQIVKPVVLGGVSYRSWQPIKHNIKALKDSVEYLNLSNNCLLGVRNDGTKNWLKEMLGNQHLNLSEFPDPGFFSLDKFKKISHSKFRRGMIISLNNEDADPRYKDGRSLDYLIEAVRKVCIEFWSKYNEPIGLAPHSFEDYELLIKLAEKFPKKYLHQSVYILPLLSGINAKNFYKFYTNPRFVIASRVHAMSPSIGFGNKTLVLSSQARMIEYLKELEISDISVDINDCEADSGIVVDKFNHLLLDHTWENRISNVRLMQEKRVLDFMSLVESML
jgi:polysaccharide pyruvyl transferase WcaK-like protein